MLDTINDQSSRPGAVVPNWTGVVRHLHITPRAFLPMRAMPEIRLIEGKGIDGEHFLHLRATQTPPQPKPNCRIQNGFYWDEAIPYPAGAHWKDAPAFVFWNGPVVRIVPSLENSLNEAHR